MPRLRPPAPKHFWSQLTEYDQALHADAKESDRRRLSRQSQQSWQYLEERQVPESGLLLPSQAVVVYWKGARVAGGILKMDGVLSVMHTHIDHDTYVPGETPVSATDTKYMYTDIPLMGDSGKSIFKIVKGIVDLESPNWNDSDFNFSDANTLETLKEASAAGLWDLEEPDYEYVLAEMQRGVSGEFLKPELPDPPREWFDN